MNDIWTIESDRLRLQVVRPGSEIYGRTRFNWNGFVNRITLDGEIEFAEPEQRDPNRGTSYGAGLWLRVPAPGRPWPRRTLARSTRAWATAT